MARPPAALAVECPSCGAAPQRPCLRLRLVSAKTIVREAVRPHASRVNALQEAMRRTRTIR